MKNALSGHRAATGVFFGVKIGVFLVCVKIHQPPKGITMSGYQCAFEGCFKSATCIPKYKAPVIVDEGAQPIDPVGVFVGVKLCPEHFVTLQKQPKYNSSVKMNQALMVAALHAGTYAPDFSKTYLHAIDLNSKEFQEFQVIQDKVKADQAKEAPKVGPVPPAPVPEPAAPAAAAVVVDDTNECLGCG